MQLEARNQPSVNSNVTIAGRPADTELDVGIVLTLGGDRRLTFTELTSATVDYEEVFPYGLSGNAAMSLGLTTSVAGIATIPSFAFDLSALLPLFDYSNQTAAAAPQHATSVYFDNIRLDLGSFITDLVEPIVAGLDTVLRPLYPLVDALYSDTKVFTTIGLGRTFDVDRDGKTSTIDLAQGSADFYSKIDVGRGQKLKEQVDDTVFFLDLIKCVMDLVRELERLDPEEGYYVDFGSYELAAFPARASSRGRSRSRPTSASASTRMASVNGAGMDSSRIHPGMCSTASTSPTSTRTAGTFPSSRWTLRWGGPGIQRPGRQGRHHRRVGGSRPHGPARRGGDRRH